MDNLRDYYLKETEKINEQQQKIDEQQKLLNKQTDNIMNKLYEIFPMLKNLNNRQSYYYHGTPDQIEKEKLFRNIGNCIISYLTGKTSFKYSFEYTFIEITEKEYNTFDKEKELKLMKSEMLSQILHCIQGTEKITEHQYIQEFINKFVKLDCYTQKPITYENLIKQGYDDYEIDRMDLTTDNYYIRFTILLSF